MTYPTDMQNVPDVWRLLDRCYRVIAGSQGPWAENPGKLLNVIDAALAQRDRFVLVPKEPDEKMGENGEMRYLEMTLIYQRNFASDPQLRAKLNAVFRAYLAAAPKPEGKL